MSQALVIQQILLFQSNTRISSVAEMDMLLVKSSRTLAPLRHRALL